MMKKLICVLLALVMVMAMTACGDENKKPYEDAVAAYNAGNYEEAATKLAALGDYSDAASLLATIQAEKAGATVEIANGEGSTSSEVAYTFKDGNMIKETITYADGTEIKNYYKYDEAGLCSSETLNTVDGGKIVINHFYENGIKVRTVRTNADKSKEEATYSYNEQGLLTTISGTTVTEFTYNAFGDLVKETVSENGEVIDSTTYAYIYSYIVG